ncbi:Plasma membrane ATPase [Phytophthora nicotianae]|uniref:Plasma membrane ATPase n=1 Tax=Phytophthora nicotianae TaxID=4792 RepID=A0A0W8D094_PHYNI|nr:Plasma membrane ATPase [Phytophthora nicotianae]
MTSAGPAGTQTIAGVPVELGQPVHVNTKKQLQRQINAIVGWNELDRAPMNVAQTMLRGNEQQIGEHPYFVCEKSVGVRYLALLVQGRCYLISQNYEIREVTLFCPVRPDRLQPGVDRNTVVPHQWTILDGLMVCDKDGNKSVLTLLLYDILALNGSPVMTSKLQDRLKLIQNDVVGPRKQLPPPKGQPPDMFQLVLQSMYPINHDFEAFRQDKKASSRIVECVYDPEWLTYIPSHDKSTWTSGSTEFNATDRGIGWRKGTAKTCAGGWKFIRCRPDRSMPLERSYLAMIEKAIGEDIKLDEIERFFPDDPSKKPQQKSRHDTPSTADDFAPPSKKKRGSGAGGGQGPGTGVCYDFQNKGVCQRGRFCHFSHCACNSTCSCTPTKNTYGSGVLICEQGLERTDYDAPPSPEVTPSSIADASSIPDKPPSLRHTNSFERDSSLKTDGNTGEEEEAGELTDNTSNICILFTLYPGNFTKLTSTEELARAQEEVRSRLQKIKQMLHRVADGAAESVDRSDSVERKEQKRSRTSAPAESISAAIAAKRSALTTKVENRLNDVHEATQSIASTSSSTVSVGCATDMERIPRIAHRTRTVQSLIRRSCVDAGTDPLESLMSNNKPIGIQMPTPGCEMETQTSLPPAPALSVSKSGSVGDQKLNVTAAVDDHHEQNNEITTSLGVQTQTTEKSEVPWEPQQDSDAIEAEMKQFLMQQVMASSGNNQNRAEEKPEEDVDPANFGSDSPRLDTIKTAELRKPPTSLARTGYRSFRLPSRPSSSNSS